MARSNNVLPGFGIALGYSAVALSLVVLLPIAALLWQASSLTWGEFLAAVSGPQAMAAYRLTLTAAFAAALVNAGFGLVVAWVLARYSFPGKRLLDAMVDLPFALPTAVSGIALAAVYSKNGWLGEHLYRLGVETAYTPLGVGIAMTFVGLPFVVRALQPVIEDLDPGMEEAAIILGASRWTALRKVIFPSILPALLAGFSMAFARALGEYGSVIFISGNLPMKTEIAAVLLVSKLEEFDFAGATAVGVSMLSASFLLLLLINALQRWAVRRSQGGGS